MSAPVSASRHPITHIRGHATLDASSLVPQIRHALSELLREYDRVVPEHGRCAEHEVRLNVGGPERTTPGVSFRISGLDPEIDATPGDDRYFEIVVTTGFVRALPVAHSGLPD